MLSEDKNEAGNWLRENIVPDGTLTPADIDAALGASRVVDGDGRAPVDLGYVDTFNVFYAAALLLDQRAGRAVIENTGTIQSFTSEGSTVTRSEGSTPQDLRDLAAWYRARAFPSGSVAVIDLGDTGGGLPRSAFEGVTPDAVSRRAGLDA